MDTPTSKTLFHLDLIIDVLICKSCQFIMNSITIQKHLHLYHSTINFKT